ncbi:hypothetical protein HV436_20050, partial [Bacillus sporothermodurans]|uniref:hypothetical protein n=1 Tax=Heyndrickxia sporothermodurans TaxID=46224 RepID=UPI001D632C1A|nr:hypothetical protein [Heyndrickxia sporothermodurans]MBL5812719.1 hypothetical protein [Heyndrickxia sporothermodurans]MBL5816146.1 hypothetical protein [Heyndrickxia sporothermodurans]MBL5819592.1 hypothetical protein [Heyndrickxia sporothermodurans]MBL5844705.1 hypothetical protein [Heyndrickxia sporothermodurans]
MDKYYEKVYGSYFIDSGLDSFIAAFGTQYPTFAYLYKADNFYSTQDSNSKWIPVTLEESEQQNETLHINVGSASIV